jgi:hypothetical protein
MDEGDPQVSDKIKNDFPSVRGFCPMGCGETLFLGEGGYVTCAWVLCPDPEAVTKILEDSETEHVVDVEDRTFSVVHPLRERIRRAVLKCGLHRHLTGLDGPPVVPGRYRVTPTPTGWTFSRIRTQEMEIPADGI